MSPSPPNKTIVMSNTNLKQGLVYERDGKRREVVRLIQGGRLIPPAVTWRRPGDEWKTNSCSLRTWNKWVESAQLVG